MGFESDEAVDDVHARLLELARPLDVGLFVEARLDLDERHDLLACFCSVDECVDNRRVARGAIQRLLDRENLRVGRGLFDESLHARRERIVGVVYEDIAFAQRGEHALGCLPLAEGGMRRRHERGVLELWPVE